MKTTAHVAEEASANVLEFEVHGTLAREDYDKLVPEIERIIDRYGKIRVLVIMHGFHGWDASALWESIKWNSKHFGDLERMAVVGDKPVEVRDVSGAFELSYRRKVRWQRWLTSFYRPFTDADVRYFRSDELDEARDWLYSDPREVLPINENTNLPIQAP